MMDGTNGSMPGAEKVGGGIMRGLVLFLIGAVVLVAVLAVYAISVRNGLVGRDEDVKAQWSGIDAQLQRRADLVPNLVSAVKGYAAHEDKIFTAVADARARLLAAGSAAAKAEAGAALDSALGRLLAIAENYPQLKASENFVRLQDELAGTENRIAVSRTRYNAAARDFNAAIRQFPGSFFAPGMGFRPAEYFQPPAGSKTLQAPPEVKF